MKDFKELMLEQRAMMIDKSAVLGERAAAPTQLETIDKKTAKISENFLFDFRFAPSITPNPVGGVSQRQRYMNDFIQNVQDILSKYPYNNILIDTKSMKDFDITNNVNFRPNNGVTNVIVVVVDDTMPIPNRPPRPIFTSSANVNKRTIIMANRPTSQSRWSPGALNTTTRPTGFGAMSGGVFVPNHTPMHEYGHILGLSDRYMEGGIYAKENNQRFNITDTYNRRTYPIMFQPGMDNGYQYLNNLYSTATATLTQFQIDTIFSGKKEDDYQHGTIGFYERIGLGQNINSFDGFLYADKYDNNIQYVLNGQLIGSPPTLFHNNPRRLRHIFFMNRNNGKPLTTTPVERDIPSLLEAALRFAE